ncbi:MAG: accessory factor UbiK family protein [Rhodospirillaceae bacterium]
MQSKNKFFDDAAKMFGGTASALIGLRREIETLIQQQFERFLASMDLVTRDEFEAVRQMALKARSEQEALVARIELLEKKIDAKQIPKSRKTTGSKVSTSASGTRARIKRASK